MNFQFQTQQIYCVRDKDGAIKEGGKVSTVFFTFHIFVLHVNKIRICELKDKPFVIFSLNLDVIWIHYVFFFY